MIMEKDIMVYQQPKVSVIVPTYGGSTSLKRAVESALNQSYNNYEIIVVDDNNPGTQERRVTENIMKIFANCSKVIYIQHERNKNGAAARNTGVLHSSGEYIAFLDDDDLYYPNKINRQVHFLESNKQYSCCYCWRIENNSIKISSELKGDLSKEILSMEFTPCTIALMMTKSSFNQISGFNESFRRHQDYEFLLRYFAHYKIGVVKEYLVERLTNEIDNQPHGKRLNMLKKQFLQEFDFKIREINKENKKFKRKVLINHYIPVIRDHLQHKHYILATQRFLLLFFRYPVFLIKTIIKRFKKRKGNQK